MVGKGRRNALLTPVEGKSGCARIGRADNMKTDTTRRGTQRRMRHLTASLRRTVTFDNGKESAEPQGHQAGRQRGYLRRSPPAPGGFA
jgi:IS30 family transposase